MCANLDRKNVNNTIERPSNGLLAWGLNGQLGSQYSNCSGQLPI